MISNVAFFYWNTIKKAVDYDQWNVVTRLLHLKKVEQSIIERVTLYKNECRWCRDEAVEWYICIMDLISAIDQWHEYKSSTRTLKCLADNVGDGTAFINQFYKELGYSDAASGRQDYGVWADYLDILLFKLRESF